MCVYLWRVCVCVGGSGFVRLSLDVAPTGKSYSFRSCERARRSCVGVFVLSLGIRTERFPSPSPPPSFLAEWSVLFAMGFYILDVLTHGSHMGFMSLSMFLQSFMHGFNGSLCIFECLVYGFYRFLSDLLQYLMGVMIFF